MGTEFKENGLGTRAGVMGLRTRIYAHEPTHPARVLAGAAPITRAHGAKYLGLTRHLYFPGFLVLSLTLVISLLRALKIPGHLGSRPTLAIILLIISRVLSFLFTAPEFPGTLAQRLTLAVSNTFSKISQGVVRTITLAVIYILGAPWNDPRILSQSCLLTVFADVWTRAQSSLRPSGSICLMKLDTR